jgi:hypothetical protein
LSQTRRRIAGHGPGAQTASAHLRYLAQLASVEEHATVSLVGRSVLVHARDLSLGKQSTLSLGSAV